MLAKTKEREKSKEISYEDFRMSFPIEKLKKENKYLTYHAVYQHMIEVKNKTGLSQEAFNMYTILLKEEIYSGEFIPSLISVD